MLIKLSSGTVYDRVHGINGEQRDIYIQDREIYRFIHSRYGWM